MDNGTAITVATAHIDLWVVAFFFVVLFVVGAAFGFTLCQMLEDEK